MAIEGTRSIQINWPDATQTDAAKPSEPGGNFSETFASALGEVRHSEQTAETLNKRFASGDPSVGIHEVMIAAEKASINLRYAVTLKNKLIEAYRELMNTQS